MNTHITSSAKETEKLGKEFAHYPDINIQNSKSIIISLEGDWAGKQPYKGFAKVGIKENIKVQHLFDEKISISNFKFLNFYHFDCYRIKTQKKF